MRNYSDELYECFGSKYCSPVIQCRCGRTNYVDNRDMAEGEFDDLAAKHKLEPNNYCYHTHDDYVASIELQGTLVFDCDCHWEEKLIKVLDDNETAFISYYKNKVKRLQKELNDSLNTIASLSKSIKDNPNGI